MYVHVYVYIYMYICIFMYSIKGNGSQCSAPMGCASLLFACLLVVGNECVFENSVCLFPSVFDSCGESKLLIYSRGKKNMENILVYLDLGKTLEYIGFTCSWMKRKLRTPSVLFLFFFKFVIFFFWLTTQCCGFWGDDTHFPSSGGSQFQRSIYQTAI